VTLGMLGCCTVVDPPSPASAQTRETLAGLELPNSSLCGIRTVLLTT
jgi:hypothetical protein